jgi:hypothetical protein
MEIPLDELINEVMDKSKEEDKDKEMDMLNEQEDRVVQAD